MGLSLCSPRRGSVCSALNVNIAGTIYLKFNMTELVLIFIYQSRPLPNQKSSRMTGSDSFNTPLSDTNSAFALL